VRNVAFSPAGDALAFCSHNSTVSFVDIVGGGSVQTVRLRELPLTAMLFLPDGSMVGVGHCYDPLLFTRTASGWAVAGKLAGKEKKQAAAGGFANARNMFQAQVVRGETAAASAADSTAGTMHSNLVRGLQPFNAAFGGTAAEFTTSALDGKIGFWTRDELAAAMGAVAIQ